MKLFRNISLMLLLLLALLIAATGCGKTPVAETQAPTTPAVTEPTTPPEPTEDVRQKELSDKYSAAVNATYGESYAVEISHESTVTVAGKTYRETGSATNDYFNIGKENFLARTKKTVVYGDDAYEVEYQETYGGGKVYQKLGDGKFYAEMTAEEYMEKGAPANMLDPALYTLSANENDTVITFESATAGESWMMPEEGAELISASGTAELNADGKLVKTTYTVQFRYGAAEYQNTYTVVPAELGREPSVPETTEEYVLLENIDASLMLEHTFGCLSQMRHVSAHSYDLIISMAAGYYQQDSFSLDAYADGDTYGAKAEDNVHVSFADGSTQSVEIVEKMIDGKYTYSMNGGKETSSSKMTQELFEGTVYDKFMELDYGSENIASVEITVVGDAVLLEFTGTEEMGEDVCYDICSMLFDDGSFLDGYATSYRTDTMEFYVALDGYSMLPTAMGINYEGIHVIDGYEYTISRQVDRSFDMGSLSAYEAIYEETEPEEAPENPATPLFYHVTGADGQEMWLLGTIHVGDNRTGFLPEEIYDAFYSADAFAIECNVEEFYEQADEDEALQKKISEMYYYSDNTMVEDHIDTPDLYEMAKKAMKATGNYFFNSDYMKVYLWSSSIDNYYLRTGYALSSEKGVEDRLLKLAEEEDIPVWEVESTLFQMEMTANYSDHLQEFQLYSSVYSSAMSYVEGVQELYELWCTGDEAALIEKLSEEEAWVIEEDDIDLTDLEGEDLERAQAILADLDNINAQLAVLQEEYNTAMSYDRNEGMLEVAMEYLESGDVVFYAVGLAHLLADNGLVTTLQDAGYTVELVTYQ